MHGTFCNCVTREICPNGVKVDMFEYILPMTDTNDDYNSYCVVYR